MIADTARSHFGTWQQLFQGRGLDFSEENSLRLFGMRSSDIILRVLGPDIPAEEMEAFSESKEEIFQSNKQEHVAEGKCAVAIVAMASFL